MSGKSTGRPRTALTPQNVDSVRVSTKDLWNASLRKDTIFRKLFSVHDFLSYDSRSARRNSRRDRDRDYYSDRDYGRRRQRSSRRYDDYDGYRRSGGRRYRY